ncbi:MAG: terpene cyclase/mutase family protein [Planctomycetota bacterium]|nr:terpene cyclase/mutase family protein [Planctomycetota bacterium]
MIHLIHFTVLLFAVTISSFGQEQVSPPVVPPTTTVGAESAPAENEITVPMVSSIDRGLAALAAQQNDNGSFGRGRYGSHAGIAALCGLAFLADGNTPTRGQYAPQVRKALDFVLESSTESGLISDPTSHGPMYGHGFATLFLGEVYGMDQGDSRVRDALVRAVRLIQSSQNDEGGWRYNPVPSDADISVTICEIMALRSARNAGIKIPKEAVDAAVRYVRECQNPDGGFRYTRGAGSSAWPRTAAGVASLFYAGIHDDQAIESGLQYLEQAGVIGGGGPMSQAHYFYGQYYAVQAMYLAGGKHWSQWWPMVRDEIIQIQSEDGTWLDHSAGTSYATSMALIVLQMPKRYLPIFQR